MKRYLGLVVAVAACTSTATPEPAPRTVEQLIESAAAEAHVPADLLRAIAIEEGGLHLAPVRAIDPEDHVPVAGLLELRHGRLDTLALAAKLAGTTEDALRADTALATRAGARVLAQLGAEHGATADLASWRRALEVLSGLDDDNARAYASRVLAIVRTGGEFAARGTETVRVAPHLEIEVAPVPPTFTASSGTPDYPGAIWFTTSCANKCTAGRPLGHASVNKIVIHDTEGGWNASVATLQNDSGKSVHYIIDADGSRVGQFRPETDTTWHAGNFHYNETSVGIEHVGVASDAAGYSAELYATSRALVKSIRTRWSVPLDRTHIVGHYQIPNGNNISESAAPCTASLDSCETSDNYGGAGNHRDPGYYWQWCQYMESLGGSCTCNDAWPLWNCTTDHTEAVRCVDGQVEISKCTGGCEVQAIGTDDVCHTDGAPPPDAGTPDADPGNPETASGGDHGGGCTTGGHDSPLALLFAALVLVRRRRAR